MSWRKLDRIVLISLIGKERNERKGGAVERVEIEQHRTALNRF